MGVIRVTAIINIENNYSSNKQTEDNTITVNPTTDNKYITFKDKNTEDWVLASFDKDKDGKISYEDAAQITNEEFFKYVNKNNWEKVVTFDELQFFTRLTDIKPLHHLFNSIILPRVPLVISDPLSVKKIQVQHTTTNKWDGVIRAEQLILSNEAVVKDFGLVNNIIVDESSINYSKINHCLLNKDQTELIFYNYNDAPINSDIPNTVKDIKDWALASAKLRNIVIPDSVTKIGDYLLNDTVTTIDVGQNVQTIGRQFAYRCPQLQKVIFRGRVNKFGDSIFAKRPFKIDIYVRDEDVDYYKGIFQAPYNTYVKPISTMN